MSASSTPSPEPPPSGRLIVVSGPSGVGKTSVVEGVVAARPVRFSVSATTRPARPGEEHGVDYLFLEREDFERRIEDGFFLEWAEYNGNLYGTPRQAVLELLAGGSDVLLDIDVQGARQVKAAYPGAVTIFVTPPSLQELERRLRARGDTADAVIAARLRIAAGEMSEGRASFDHVVINDELQRAVADVLDILGPPEQGTHHD